MRVCTEREDAAPAEGSGSLADKRRGGLKSREKRGGRRTRNSLAHATLHEYNLTHQPSEGVALLETSTMLLGRKWEMGQILAVLNRRMPALVVVTGPPGIGKSRLLRAVREWAVQQGWKTAPQQPGDQLSVRRPTTRHSFCEQVERALPAQARERFEGVIDERLRGVALGEPAPQRSPVDDARAESSDPDEPRAPAAAPGSGLAKASSLPDDGGATNLLARLRQHEPLVILIDEYAPEPQFEAWFLDSIIGSLEESRSPTVVIVATEGDGIDDPRAQLVSLAALDRTEVSDHFGALVRQLDPPADEAELMHYVAVACETPAVIDSLERILKLARHQTV